MKRRAVNLGGDLRTSPTGGDDVALRGERMLAAAVAAVGGDRFRSRIATEAARYWADPAAADWETNSHWRNGIGDQAWLEVGEDHWTIFESFSRALQLSPLGTVMEWGAGGGANAVAFAPRARKFVAADISRDNLDECVRQVQATCDTPIETRCIDLGDPERAIAGLEGSCDVFLCLYVIELTTGRDAVDAVLQTARKALVPGGVAMIQIKYHTVDGRTRGRPGVTYQRNLASSTTFTIEDFWQIATDSGLIPRLITLVPENRLDRRYAYYALTAP